MQSVAQHRTDFRKVSSDKALKMSPPQCLNSHRQQAVKREEGTENIYSGSMQEQSLIQTVGKDEALTQPGVRGGEGFLTEGIPNLKSRLLMGVG